MRIKEIKIAPFNTVQDIEDNDFIAITGNLSADIAEAVKSDHYCTDSFCDIYAALEAGFPLVAAGILIGATECAHVDAVLCAYKFMGQLDDKHNPGDMYSLAEWDGWSTWFDENSRQCRGCGGYGFEVEVGWDCGNCGGKYGYRAGDQLFIMHSNIDPEFEGEDYGIDVEVKSFGEGVIEMADPNLPPDVFWLQVVDLDNGREFEIRTDYIE